MCVNVCEGDKERDRGRESAVEGVRVKGELQSILKTLLVL